MPFMYSSEDDVSSLLEVKSTFVTTSIYVSVLAFFLYDYLISLSREIELMWKGKFQLGTVLYFSARYLAFFMLVFDVAGDYTKSNCTLALRFMDALTIISRAGVAAILVAYTYSLYNRSRVILTFLGVLWAALLGLDSWKAARDTCSPYSTSPNAQLRATLSTVVLTLFSSSVMCLSLYKVYGFIQRQGVFRVCLPGPNFKLTKLLAFEGVYVSGVCIMRLINTILVIIAPTLAYGGPFILPICSILVSRFLLSLRDINGHAGRTGSTVSRALATIRMDPHEVQLNVHEKPLGNSQDPMHSPGAMSGTTQDLEIGTLSGETQSVQTPGSCDKSFNIPEKWMVHDEDDA